MNILVTGGAGFIGSTLVRRLVARGADVVTVDKLTYAGNLESLEEVLDHPRHRFVRADICDAPVVRSILAELQPDAVFHLAAESHVDRSIDGAADFVRTNIEGTFTLLEEALRYWRYIGEGRQQAFRFMQVSTDEVFGSLSLEDGCFTERSPYRPSSPYAATKAGADHLALAWHRTYGLPVVLTFSSNNYGPRQFPEKLIPLTTINALEGKELAVYGSGEHRRDWIYVDNHVDALLAALEHGRVGETYAFASGEERTNLDVVRSLCAVLDELVPDPDLTPRERLIRFVADRPGHDFRYATNPEKSQRELGWRSSVSFEEGLRRTVEWFLAHREWWERVRASVYGGERLGLGARP